MKKARKDVSHIVSFSLSWRINDNGRQNVEHEFLVEVGEKTGEPDWEQTEVKWFEFSEIDLDNMVFDHSKTIKLLQSYIDRKIMLPIVD